jgi:hypothetical protein
MTLTYAFPPSPIELPAQLTNKRARLGAIKIEIFFCFFLYFLFGDLKNTDDEFQPNN